ncbi:hypothetical protein AKJ09_04587 [Labilithrix luteola]|uniref:Uncharacterized protein n=1 Tax=Labilithrix luteola TaxID=1391654 RepID=A0A0K1PWL6_9BACT|nr:hypothetical protein AKJ09_04587 [Labilithrix luteola]
MEREPRARRVAIHQASVRREVGESRLRSCGARESLQDLWRCRPGLARERIELSVSIGFEEDAAGPEPCDLRLTISRTSARFCVDDEVDRLVTIVEDGDLTLSC